MGRLAEGEEYGWQLYGGDVGVRLRAEVDLLPPPQDPGQGGPDPQRAGWPAGTVTLRRTELDERFPGLLEAVLR